MNDDQLLNEIIQAKQELHTQYVNHYKTSELNHWAWWVAVALLIIPLILWWFKVDKKRLFEISFFGLLVNALCSILTTVGSNYNLWIYPIHIVPQFSLLFPVDYVIVPVIGMTLYQRLPNWRFFTLGSLAVSIAISFIVLPLAAYIHLYKLISWHYIYSLPIFFAIYMAAKAVTELFMRTQKRWREKEWYAKSVSFKRPPKSAQNNTATGGGSESRPTQNRRA